MMTMSELSDSIRKYHERMHPDHLGFTVDTLPPWLLSFRRKLDDEETREVAEAWDEVDTIAELQLQPGDELIGHLLHELADRTIVAYGTADYLGVSFDDVLRAVMRANMRKVPPAAPGGKATKPAGWQPADAVIVEIVKQARRSADPFAVAERAKPAATRYHGTGPVFEARYEGECQSCGGEIEPGDECRMVDGEIEHANCGDDGYLDRYGTDVRSGS